MAHCNFFCFSQVSPDHTIYYYFCNLLVNFQLSYITNQPTTSLKTDRSLTYFTSLHSTKHNTLLEKVQNACKCLLSTYYVSDTFKY